MVKKLALITGGCTRIGQIVAIFLAEKGFDLILHYNLSKKSEELKVYLKNKYNINVTTIKIDFYSSPNPEKQIMALFQKNCSDYNLLFNNAAIFKKIPFLDYDKKIFESIMKINFQTPFELTKNFCKLATINPTKKFIIINISDALVIKKKYSSYFLYKITKDCIDSFTNMASVELKGYKNISLHILRLHKIFNQEANNNNINKDKLKQFIKEINKILSINNI